MQYCRPIDNYNTSLGAQAIVDNRVDITEVARLVLTGELGQTTPEVIHIPQELTDYDQVWEGSIQQPAPKPLPRNAPILLMRYLIGYMLRWLFQKAPPIISGLFDFAMFDFVGVSIWMMYVSVQLNNASSAILYGEMCIIGLLILALRRLDRLLRPKAAHVIRLRPFNEYFDDVCRIIGIK